MCLVDLGSQVNAGIRAPSTARDLESAQRKNTSVRQDPKDGEQCLNRAKSEENPRGSSQRYCECLCLCFQSCVCVCGCGLFVSDPCSWFGSSFCLCLCFVFGERGSSLCVCCFLLCLCESVSTTCSTNSRCTDVRDCVLRNLRVRGCFIVISIRDLFRHFVGHDAWFGWVFGERTLFVIAFVFATSRTTLLVAVCLWTRCGEWLFCLVGFWFSRCSSHFVLQIEIGGVPDVVVHVCRGRVVYVCVWFHGVYVSVSASVSDRHSEAFCAHTPSFRSTSARKPATTLHMYRTSSLRTPAVPTSPSCLTLTRPSPTLQSSSSLKPLPAKIRGEWLPWLCVVCCVAPHSQALPRSRAAQSTSTI